MILKMTFNDNDFTDLLFSFAKNMHVYTTVGVKPTSSLSTEELIENRKDWKKYNDLLNPNIKTTHTEEEKEIILERCKDKLEEYITYYATSERTKEYLKKNLKVEMLKSLEDKWENGEVVYWLQHSGAVIRQ